METFYGHALKEYTSDILVCSVKKIYLVETSTENIVIESTANSDFQLGFTRMDFKKGGEAYSEVYILI